MNKSRVLVFLLAISNNYLFSQWQITNTTINLRAVDFVNDSTGLFVHNMIDGSYILKTVDYGVTLDTVVTYAPNVYFDDVVFASDTVAYACGSYNLFLKSIDGGNTWFDPTEGQDPTFNDLYFINDTLGYASYGDGNGRLASTADGGFSWLIYEEGEARDIVCLSNCHCIATTSSRIYSTYNCGQTWPCDTIDYLNRDINTLWFHDSNYGFLGARGGFGTYFQFNFGSIRRTFDGGETFDILDFPLTSSISDLFFVDGLTGYAGCSPYDGYQYSILKTIDGGETWGYQDIDLNPNFDDYTGIHEIDCPSPGYCYAVGGGIYRTTNGGGAIYEAWVEVGVSENQSKPSTLNVFPNPTTDLLTLSGITQSSKPTIKITDTTGRSLMTEYNPAAKGQSGPDIRQIDVAHLPNGIYFIEVSTESCRTVLKFVKE